MIGTISNDPTFGTTSASTYLELKPTFYPFAFTGKKDDLIVDSAVLILSYRSIYGDSTKPQTWRVFEVTNPLKNDSLYGVNKSNIAIGGLLGEKISFDPRRLQDSMNYGFEKAKNQIRIRMSASFAQRMIKTFDSTNAYANDSAFRSRFRGFAVVPDQGLGNALISVNLLDSNTKLALFYKYKTTEAPIKDSPTVSYFRFIANSVTPTSASANIVKRDITGSTLAQHIGPKANDSLVYVQASPGTYVSLKVPALSSLPNSIIHRAELVAEQVPTANPMLDAYFSPPRYLLLAAYDTSKKVKVNVPNDYIVDLQGTSNIGTFGGFLTYNDNGTTRNAIYEFNLTRYVQGIVTRREPNYMLQLSAPSNDTIRYKDPYPSTIFNTFYIVPGSSNVIANGRVQLGGGGIAANKPYRMRLRIIYSRL